MFARESSANTSATKQHNTQNAPVVATGTMLDRKKVGLVERDANTFGKDPAGLSKTSEPRKKTVVASSMMKLLETNQPIPGKGMNGLKKATGKATSFFGLKQ